MMLSVNVNQLSVVNMPCLRIHGALLPPYPPPLLSSLHGVSVTDLFFL
jgi:hypothetical protein